jgi:hypothetical protein
MHKRIIEEITVMYQAEGDIPERDPAKIVDYNATQSNFRKKVLGEVLERCEKILSKGKPSQENQL